MKHSILTVIGALVLSLNGCCLFVEGDEALLREIRLDLVESIRPVLVNALDKAKNEDGSSVYIDELKTEKINLLDQVVQSVDRIYPPVDTNGDADPYMPNATPWGN